MAAKMNRRSVDGLESSETDGCEAIISIKVILSGIDSIFVTVICYETDIIYV